MFHYHYMFKIIIKNMLNIIIRSLLASIIHIPSNILILFILDKMKCNKSKNFVMYIIRILNFYAYNKILSYLGKIMNDRFKNIFTRREKKFSIIPLIDNYDSKNVINQNFLYFDIPLYLKFVDLYNKIDKNQDIVIIIQLTNINLTLVEAICNHILDHKGKITCYIPNYILSTGLLVTLCCDTIILHRNAIIALCDNKIITKKGIQYSLSSIINTVNYKQTRDHPIKENWLAFYCEAKKYIDKRTLLLEHICKKKYNNKIKRYIINEFFNNKNSYDKMFSAQEFKNILNDFKIKIVDQIPDNIENYIKISVNLDY